MSSEHVNLWTIKVCYIALKWPFLECCCHLMWWKYFSLMTYLYLHVYLFFETRQNFKGLELCWQKVYSFVQYYSLVNTVCSFIFSSKVLTLWTLVYIEIPEVKTILFQNWPLHSIVNNFESNNWFQPGKLLTIVLKSNVNKAKSL